MDTIHNPESKTVAFVTLGCKVNQYETQVMREALRERGYRIVAADEKADVYVINTCTVTGVSDRKSRQMIRRAAALNPDAVIVVTGCYVERCADEIRDIPGVDLVLSNSEKYLIGEYLEEFEGEIPLNPPLTEGDFRNTPIPAFPRRGGGSSVDDRETSLNPDLREVNTTSESANGCREQARDSPLEKGARGLYKAHQRTEGTEAHVQRSANQQPPESPFVKGDLSRQGERSFSLYQRINPDSPLSQRGVKGDLRDKFSDRTVSGGDFSWHPGITSFDGQTRALVKIQDGCDSFCTYCIVPYTRGGIIRSRPVDSIVREVLSLAGNGHREVVLTGIHLGAYGRDMRDGTKLSHVLRAVHDVDGIERIRLSSIEPMDVSNDLIDVMAHLPKCAHHFHVSLQSGSDRILRLMRRGYTSANFEDVASRIKAAMPDVGLSTDVMVGFPGETQGDFKDTCDLISRVRFSRLHVFRYSPRSGTPAARFPDRVQDSVASRRSEEARALGDDLAQEFRSRMLGKVAEVLVEDSREGEYKFLAGFTGNYVRALLADAPDELAGQMVRVRLVDIESGYMIGRLER